MHCCALAFLTALTYSILCRFFCQTACQAQFLHFRSMFRRRRGNIVLDLSSDNHQLENDYGNRKIDTQQRRLGTLHDLKYTRIDDVPIPLAYPKGTSDYSTRRWYTVWFFSTRSEAITKNFYYYYDDNKCNEQTPCPAYFYMDGTLNAGDIQP